MWGPSRSLASDPECLVVYHLFSPLQHTICMLSFAFFTVYIRRYAKRQVYLRRILAGTYIGRELMSFSLWCELILAGPLRVAVSSPGTALFLICTTEHHACQIITNGCLCASCTERQKRKI